MINEPVMIEAYLVFDKDRFFSQILKGRNNGVTPLGQG